MRQESIIDATPRSTDRWEAELGERVRLARKRMRLTQAQLAERANISLSAERALESGAGSTLASFIKVLRALGIEQELDRVFLPRATVSPMAALRARSQAKSSVDHD